MLNILQSFLAFAATMLVLATLVTIMIEILSRFFRRRHRVFTHLLQQLFEKELQPLIEDKIRKDLGDDSEKIREAIKSRLTTFLDDIRNSPLKPQKDRKLLSRLGGWIRWFGADRSARLTTEEFIRRFARSQIGSDVYQMTAGYIDRLVDSVCLRYEELTDAMREYITNSSSVLSIVIGIIIALVINIDAHRLFDFYIKNPEVAAEVADNAAAYADAYIDAQQRVKEALAALDREETVSAKSKAKAKQEIEALKNRLETVPAIVNALKAQGIPLGLDYFPHCRFRDPVEVGPLTVYPCLETDERFRAYFSSDKKTDDQASLWPDYFWWIVKILITGILIGLGGPFWYDAVRGLARATQLLRGRAQPQQTPTGSLPGEETPAQPAEIFKRYVEKTPDGGRIQPQPDST